MTTTSDSVVTDGDREMLQRILVAVESKRTGRLEVVIALLLSLTTLASTWCGYQANLWSGVSSASQSAADTAERAAAESKILALERRTQDGLVLLDFWRAVRAEDTSAVEFLRSRMHPSLQRAVAAAEAARVIDNPQEPGPLHRPEYRLEEDEEARVKRAEAASFRKTSADASDASASYVLLTLVCASILFVGGIAGTFARRPIRVSLLTIAGLIFLVVLFALTRLPAAGV